MDFKSIIVLFVVSCFDVVQVTGQVVVGCPDVHVFHFHHAFKKGIVNTSPLRFSTADDYFLTVWKYMNLNITASMDTTFKHDNTTDYNIHGLLLPYGPGLVNNFTLTLDNWLLWEEPYDPPCRASHYVIHIEHELGEYETTYATAGTSLYIHFLQICEHYYFNIVAMSPLGGIGPEHWIYAKMPFPLDADLTVGSFSIAPHDRDVRLEWKVEEEWRKCADRFRVTVYDVETDIPLDLYVSNDNATITNLAPCTTYTFGVRAVYNLGTEGPYSSIRYTTAAATLSTPTLQGITLGRTTIDLTWQLESYLVNRCAATALVIDASPHFTITYPITDQINRPPFSTRLAGLQPDTFYVLNVSVINTAGVSSPALVAVQTLE